MNKKIITILMAIVMLLPMAVAANASEISNAAAFNFDVKKSDSDSFKDCIRADLYCSADGAAKITTLGCTIVIDTTAVDTVDSSGKVNTSEYLSEAKQISGGSSITAAKFGSGRRAQSFTFDGLSIASYNSSTKELYIFLCGMNATGIVIPNSATKVAEIYFKQKSGASLSDNSIRIMKESEYKNEAMCPCSSVYPAEISSKEEVADMVKSISMKVDPALITASSQPTSSPSGGATDPSAAQTTAKMQSTSGAAAKMEDLSSAIKSAESLLEQINSTQATDDNGENVPADKKEQLEKAIAKAKEVLTSEDATPEEIQQAINELNLAVKEYNEAVNGENSSNKTAVIIIICAVAAVLIAAIAAVIIVKNKKDKDNSEEASQEDSVE